MPKRFRRPASADIATIQSGFQRGRWRTSRIDFQPIDSRRLDEGFTRDEFSAIMDEDEAQTRLIAMGSPGMYFRELSSRFDTVLGLVRRFTRIRSLDMSHGSLFKFRNSATDSDLIKQARGTASICASQWFSVPGQSSMSSEHCRALDSRRGILILSQERRMKEWVYMLVLNINTTSQEASTSANLTEA